MKFWEDFLKGFLKRSNGRLEHKSQNFFKVVNKELYKNTKEVLEIRYLLQFSSDLHQLKKGEKSNMKSQKRRAIFIKFHQSISRYLA